MHLFLLFVRVLRIRRGGLYSSHIFNYLDQEKLILVGSLLFSRRKTDFFCACLTCIVHSHFTAQSNVTVTLVLDLQECMDV